MKDQEFGTLAYTKSPKTSKRTTFQDELQAAVSSRASKTKTKQFNYEDLDDDEDDFLNQLIKSRKKKTDGFNVAKSKAKCSAFDLSDDEDRHSRTKKVSFLKTQRNSSQSDDTAGSEPHEDKPPESPVDGFDSYNGSFSSQHPTNVSEENTQFKNSDLESGNSQVTRGNSSLSFQTSDDTLPLPLPSDGSVADTPGPAEKTRNSVIDNVTERDPPKPKPRQRTFGLKFHPPEKPSEETASQDLSRQQTSSASIPLSTDTSSNIVWTDGDHAASSSLPKSSSNKSEESQPPNKHTSDSGSKDGFIPDDSKDPEGKYSSSFEEFNECSGNQKDQLSHSPEKSFDTRTSSPHSKTIERSQSVCSRKVESKYLGSLKVLDRKVSLQDSEPQVGDSVRAAVYQEWLQKKKEKSRENIQLKKREELRKEKEIKDKEAKKEDAIASYEAWKEKKAEYFKARAKERKDMVIKEQRATEEKEEKKQTAKQVFERWKREHDDLLKERYRKREEAENERKLQKQDKLEEKTRESKSAFSNWCEKKKDVVHEKLSMERKELKNQEEEEQYLKEERDKMALEMYENWLRRKDLEQKRRRDERRIQEILSDSPPPPWSPPSKTIPFRK
ncbi:microtubule-associated protein 9 [Cololabis saira]|uniref:microtubule-associated protein 9 n=1 Tax=Cololabis saira TaxID=129043 RepID=UPI002AD3979E|nr:microtubule-associated protein 9 [Cololabis saira]